MMGCMIGCTRGLYQQGTGTCRNTEANTHPGTHVLHPIAMRFQPACDMGKHNFDPNVLGALRAPKLSRLAGS